MTPSEYVAAAIRTESVPELTIPESTAGLLRAAMNQCVAAGEKQDVLKRHFFYGRPLGILAGTVPASSSLAVESSLSPHLVRILHAAMGICTESGELQEQLRRHLFEGKPLDHVNLVEEIGDAMWYVAVLCSVLCVSLEDVMQLNIAKLRKRYPERFSEEAAVVRDLEGERNILEGR